MQDKYKLCERAGLEVLYFCRQGYKTQGEWIYAADVEKLLEGAPVVYGRPDIDPEDGFMFGWSDCRTLDGNEEGYYPDTHSARLVMIEPIAKDTVESLLREMIDREDWSFTPHVDWIKRARRLLEGK